jgi:hypothetical protein
MIEVAVAKLPCPLQTMEVTLVELLAQYEEMVYVELVDQKEWQVHGSWVMVSVFDLTVRAISMVISAHLRNFCTGSTV